MVIVFGTGDFDLLLRTSFRHLLLALFDRFFVLLLKFRQTLLHPVECGIDMMEKIRFFSNFGAARSS